MQNELLDKLTGDLTFITSFSRREVMELYEEVNEFVINNFLCDGPDEMYYLRYNDRFYQVGYTYGPQAMYYVMALKKGETVNSFVDYEMMKNNQLTEKEQERKDFICDIHSRVDNLKEKGASLELLNKSFKYWKAK